MADVRQAGSFGKYIFGYNSTGWPELSDTTVHFCL